ncbi:HNH endonuclease [Mesomycoplasma moatsii]|uniref:HNH endonuclease n=1 Tax=Mesomycoplasma moatsii TaxID=171287 RepID=UPI0003B40476
MQKVSELINNPFIQISPFLHGAIFSRIIVSGCNKYFLIPSSFKESKKTKTKLSNILVEKYIESLNFYTQSKNNKWINEKTRKENYKDIFWDANLSSLKSSYIIINDSNITKEKFLQMIHFNLLVQQYIDENKLNENKKNFIRGFIETRGSIDLSRNYISIDYFYDSISELKRAIVLIDHMSVPGNCLNINFRELQEQFKTGINKRNTQLRIKLDWYIKNIGILNEYKEKILLDNNRSIDKKNQYITYFKSLTNIEQFINKSSMFNYRVNFYLDNVLNKKLNDFQVKVLKAKLGMSSNNENFKTKRNIFVKEMCRIVKDDKCSGCFDRYNINDRSFIHAKNNKYYFEIHHNIPFANGQEFDVLENLVKLCPICHKMLTKGIALEKDQKKSNKKYFNIKWRC